MIKIVDFYATWCGPCKVLSKTLEEIKELPDVTIEKVDIEDNPELTEQYKVRSVPTLVFFKNDEMKATTVGAISKEKLMSIIDKLKEE